MTLITASRFVLKNTSPSAFRFNKVICKFVAIMSIACHCYPFYKVALFPRWNWTRHCWCVLKGLPIPNPLLNYATYKSLLYTVFCCVISKRRLKWSRRVTHKLHELIVTCSSWTCSPSYNQATDAPHHPSPASHNAGYDRRTAPRVKRHSGRRRETHTGPVAPTLEEDMGATLNVFSTNTVHSHC